MTAAAIAAKYVGIPFKNRGRDLSGLDCYGLVKLIYADHGVKLYDIEEDYNAKTFVLKKNYFLENYYREWVEIDPPVKLLDVVAMKNCEGQMYHIGVCLGDGKFIHTIKAGTVICHLNVWKDKILGFYRHK